MSGMICFVGLMFLGSSVYNFLFRSKADPYFFPNRYGERYVPSTGVAIALNIFVFLVGVFIFFLGLDLAMDHKLMKWFS